MISTGDGTQPDQARDGRQRIPGNMEHQNEDGRHRWVWQTNFFLVFILSRPSSNFISFANLMELLRYYAKLDWMMRNEHIQHTPSPDDLIIKPLRRTQDGVIAYVALNMSHLKVMNMVTENMTDFDLNFPNSGDLHVTIAYEAEFASWSSFHKTCFNLQNTLHVMQNRPLWGITSIQCGIKHDVARLGNRSELWALCSMLNDFIVPGGDNNMNYHITLRTH